MYYFIPFLLMVFSCELEYSDINWHRQPPLHLSKKNREVVHAHLKGTAHCISLICHSMVFFNPLTYVLYPLTGYPLTKFFNPLLKFFFESFCFGVAFTTRYASARDIFNLTCMPLLWQTHCVWGCH